MHSDSGGHHVEGFHKGQQGSKEMWIVVAESLEGIFCVVIFKKARAFYFHTTNPTIIF